MEFVDVFGFNVLNATNPNNNINNGWIQVNMIHDLAKPCCILMQVVHQLLWLLNQPEWHDLVEVPT
jgi:hypothetical protein